MPANLTQNCTVQCSEKLYTPHLACLLLNIKAIQRKKTEQVTCLERLPGGDQQFSNDKYKILAEND